jgi:serine/threonine protein phosphatase PrpC
MVNIKSTSLNAIAFSQMSGDLYLLCSYGLFDLIDDNRIQEIQLMDGLLTDKATRFVDLANAAGGRDNITVLLARISHAFFDMKNTGWCFQTLQYPHHKCIDTIFDE